MVFALSESLAFDGELDPRTPNVIARRAYIYGRIGAAESAARQIELLGDVATRLRVHQTAWAVAFLGVRDYPRVLEYLEAAADSSHDDGWFDEFARNVLMDPGLDQPEFEDVRNRLSLR